MPFNPMMAARNIPNGMQMNNNLARKAMANNQK